VSTGPNPDLTSRTFVSGWGVEASRPLEDAPANKGRVEGGSGRRNKMWSWDAHWVWGAVMMALFWGVLTWIVYVLARSRDHGDGGRSPRSPRSPQAILDERLARGEISLEQYRELTHEIGEHSAL
jgi:putative membrane protein